MAPTEETPAKDVTQTVASGENTSEPTQSLAEQRNFKETCFVFRTKLEALKKEVFLMREHPVYVSDIEEATTTTHLHGEMKANIMLAYRHLEDARMRIGKAIQAYDGGASCYPR